MPTAVSEGTFVDVFDIGTKIRRNKINNLLYSMLNMGKSPKIDKPPNFRNVLGFRKLSSSSLAFLSVQGKECSNLYNYAHHCFIQYLHELS